MPDQRDKGFAEAHTPPSAGAESAPGGDQVAPAELGGSDPEGLFAGLPGDQAADVLELVADQTLDRRRAPGRPRGAANRKNADLINYLAARGHRDPWVTLSLIQSADFDALCKMVGAHKGKEKLAVLKLQQQCAADIMPYHHSRKPQQLELPDTGKRPLMVIGEMTVNQISHDGFMSAGIPPDQVQGNQRVIDGAPVRDKGEAGEADASD